MDTKLQHRLDTLNEQMSRLTEYYNQLTREAELCSKNMLIMQGRIEEVKAMLGEEGDVTDRVGEATT